MVYLGANLFTLRAAVSSAGSSFRDKNLHISAYHGSICSSAQHHHFFNGLSARVGDLQNCYRILQTNVCCGPELRQSVGLVVLCPRHILDHHFLEPGPPLFELLFIQLQPRVKDSGFLIYLGYRQLGVAEYMHFRRSRSFSQFEAKESGYIFCSIVGDRKGKLGSIFEILSLGSYQNNLTGTFIMM